MDISFIRQHRLCRNNELRRALVVITMASVSSSASTSAGVTVGSEIVTAQISSNTVTLTYIEPLENAPYIIAYPQSPSNTAVNITTNTATSCVFSAVQRDSNGTGVTTGVILLDILVPVGLSTI